jgi:hypothetical protein
MKVSTMASIDTIDRMAAPPGIQKASYDDTAATVSASVGEGDIMDGLIDCDPEDEVECILLSVYVRDWIRKNANNPTLMNLFKIRINDLARGKRTYCNFKPLVGCRTTRIFESKLNRGDRIIFTKWFRVDENDTDIEKECLLIWCVSLTVCFCIILPVLYTHLIYDTFSRCVSSHDKVPFYMDKIGKSHKNKVIPDAQWTFLQRESGRTERGDLLLVDPNGNNMLRTFYVPATVEEIDRIGETDWNPPLELSKLEIDIVKLDRSVLLLGRGGTGKTYCLCCRIFKDQTRLNNCKAIFVSHTERLKNNVEYIYKNISETHGDKIRSSNVLYKTTIKSLTDYLYRDLRRIFGTDFSTTSVDFTDTRNRITFARFRKEFYEDFLLSKDKKRKSTDPDFRHISPLRAWTQIYSFIKGSIEAAKSSEKCISRAEYTEGEAFSSGRCRLEKEDREIAYSIYERYRDWCASCTPRVWDQMDLVLVVYDMLMHYNRAGYEPFYNRVYVDEVQDLTQAEIGLIFMMSSRNDKDAYFFAGGN